MTPSRTAARSVRALILGLLAGASGRTLCAGLAAAEEGIPKPPPAASAPPIPSDPQAAELARAIREAKKEHDAEKERGDREAREEGDRISAETQALSALREEEKGLLQKLRSLEAEVQAIDEKAATAQAEEERASDSLKAAHAELVLQAASFQERQTGSLAAVEDPKLVEVALEVAKAGQPLSERVALLLDAYEKVLLYARTAAVFPLPLRVSSAGGKVEKLNVLRLGLLGGYYGRPAKREGGFVFPDPETKTGFVAEAEGLSAAEQEAVFAMILRPEKGGTVPSDLTGGAALASLRERDTPRTWFQRGGPFLWALLAIGLTAMVLVIERALALSLGALGLSRRIRMVMDLVSSGRLDAAQTTCARMGGGAGRVLGAALLHRNDSRAVLEAAVEEALLREAPRFQARLGFISLAATLAPLVGILGTVAALLGTFKMLAVLGFTDPRYVSGGVSQALISTEAGLYVAIPCVLFRGLLGALSERGLEKLEAGAFSVVIALLKLKESPLEVSEAA